MASPRQLRHSLLVRLIARVTILALLAGFLPADARASMPASPAAIDSYTLPDLAPAALASAGDVLVCVVVVVADPSGLTKSAFGELISHTGSDPQPYAFAGEPLDPNSGFQYHRARWMDPRTGRFTGMDPWPGNVFEPITLHKYLYANVDAVNRTDPSGRESLGTQLTAISGAVGVFLSNFGARLTNAFATGGPVLGQFFNDIGRYAQGRTLDVLQLYQRFNPQLLIQEGKEAGPRIIDFFVRFGSRAAYIETKWGLPWRRGEALTRLVEQVKAAVATGEGEVVLFTIRFPNTAQLNLLKAELGNIQVTLVHGVEAWGEWLTRFVR